MTNNYVVSFYAGTSGRLISNIIWALISGVEYEYILTEFNSTHNFSPFAITVDLSTVPNKDGRLYRDTDIYDYFKFIESPGLLCCHTYPNFPVLNNRYPNTKTVIISYLSSDIPEIVTNILLKNGFESLKKQDNQSTNMIKKLYKRLFGNEYIGQEISINEQRQIIKLYEDVVMPEIGTSKFLNPIFPEDQDVLVIRYSDLCNDMDLVLNQLSKFTNVPMKDNIIKLYDSYLEGRQRILNQYLY